MPGKGVAAFWEKQAQLGAGRYAGARQTAALRVTALRRDSDKSLVAATGTIDGEIGFTVPLRGAEAAVGDTLLVSYPRGEPVGAELTYERHLAAAAGAGLVAVDANLPAPVFGTPFYTTRIDSSYGGVTTRSTIYFVPVEAKFRPTGYTVSVNINQFTGGVWVRGDWQDQHVPHLGGAQQLTEVASGIAPGTKVEVRLRAKYSWAAAESVESETRQFTTAIEAAPTAGAAGLTFDVSVPGQAQLTASPDAATLAAMAGNTFAGWIYTIATSAGGAGAADSLPQPGSLLYINAAGTYYAKVRPRMISGQDGAPYPPTGYLAFTIAAPVVPTFDTTPPPAWTVAPTLTPLVYSSADGVTHNRLTIDLPGGYAYPADYDYTEVRVLGPAGLPSFYAIPYPATQLVLQDTYFGLNTVDVRGVDKLGNKTGGYGPAATATLTAPTAPTGTPSITCTPVSLGVKVAWAYIAGALSYDIERSDDAAGTVNVQPINSVQGNFYVDTLAGIAVVLPTYYYRVRATNVGGPGPWSGRVSGTVGAFSGANIAAGTITANQLQANLVLAGKLATGVYPENYVAMEGGTDDRFVGYESSRATPTVILDFQALRFMQPPPNDAYPKMRLNNSGLILYQAGSTGATFATFNSTGISLSGNVKNFMDTEGIYVQTGGGTPRNYGLTGNSFGVVTAVLPGLIAREFYSLNWNADVTVTVPFIVSGQNSDLRGMAVGQHPSLGASYNALWPTTVVGAGAYALAQSTDGVTTLINAQTNVLIRQSNIGIVTFDTNGLNLLSGKQIYTQGSASTYGSISVNGSKSGWYGINFRGGATNIGTLMTDGTNWGMFNSADNAWLWYVNGSTLNIGTVPVANVSGLANSATIPGTAAQTPNTVAVRDANGSCYFDGVQFTSPAVLGIDDLWTYRSANSATSSLYLNAAKDRYLQWNNSQYVFPGGGVNANGVTLTSARALKRQIRDYTDGLALIRGLRFRSFRWNAAAGVTDDGKRHTGLIYEEAIAIDPELGLETEPLDGGDVIKSLNYGSVHNAGMRAIQQLADSVDSLQAQLAQALARLAQLENNRDGAALS